MRLHKVRRNALVASLACVFVASATAAWAVISSGSVSQTNTYTAASLTSAPTIGTSTHASDFSNTGTVTANWTALGSTNNDGYQVNRAPLSSGSCGTFAQVGSNVTGFASSSFNDTTAAYNSSYCYRVNSYFGSTFTGPNSNNDIALSVPPSSGFDTTGGWASQTSNDTRVLNGVSALDSTHVWAVGGNNSNADVDFFNGTTWTLTQLTPNTGALNGVFALDTTHVWAVGNAATGNKLSIWFWNGSSWTNQTSGISSSSNLMGVWAADSTHAWAVGTNGTIYFFNGTTWASQASSITQDLEAVYGTDASHVWAVGMHDGSGATKHEKIDFFNGTSWSDAGLVGTVDFAGVWAADSSHVWAVGSGGNMRFFNGTSWSADAVLGAGQDLKAIGGNDISHIWTVGASNGTTGTVLFNGTGGGTAGSWTAQPLTTASNAVLRGVDAADAFHAWTVGDGGAIFTKTAAAVTVSSLATEDGTTYSNTANWAGNLPASPTSCPASALVLNVGTAVPGTPTLGSLKVTLSTKISAAPGGPTAQVLISGDSGATWAGNNTPQALVNSTTTASNLTFDLLAQWNSLATKSLANAQLCIFAAPNGGPSFKTLIDLVHMDVN